MTTQFLLSPSILVILLHFLPRYLFCFALYNFLSNLFVYLASFVNMIGTIGKTPFDDQSEQEPITRSLQLPHIPVTAFSQTDLFLV